MTATPASARPSQLINQVGGYLTQLAAVADVLVKHGELSVRIEGNCDERGTAEYNLALGQKRADTAKNFLEGMGISADRLQTISYGEERPLDKGQNEAAWAKNRRVDFVPIQGVSRPRTGRAEKDSRQ